MFSQSHLHQDFFVFQTKFASFVANLLIQIHKFLVSGNARKRTKIQQIEHVSCVISWFLIGGKNNNNKTAERSHFWSIILLIGFAHSHFHLVEFYAEKKREKGEKKLSKLKTRTVLNELVLLSRQNLKSRLIKFLLISLKCLRCVIIVGNLWHALFTTEAAVHSKRPNFRINIHNHQTNVSSFFCLNRFI